MLGDNWQKGRYKKIRKIGEGSYGSVIEVFDEELKKIIALKKIKFCSQDQGMPINALREISFLKNLNHDHILKIYQIYYEYFQSKLYITMQLMPENLQQHLKRNFPFSPWAVKSYFFQLVSATVYLHTHLIMHRDIKPQNILVATNGKLKFCDFGQSKYFATKQIKHSQQIGTLWYKAPQILLGQNYDSSVDVWALGCILSEIADGHPLFQSQNQLHLMGLIVQTCGDPNDPSIQGLLKYRLDQDKKSKKAKNCISENLCQQGNDLLKQILQINPYKRIPIGKILKHNFFEGYQ